MLKRGAVLAGFSTELWTLPRVSEVIAERFGRRYSVALVSRVLRGLGFSCQRPTGRAIQRDEAASGQWKRKRWPELKKRRKTEANHRLRRRVGAERAPNRRPQLGAALSDSGPPVQLFLAPVVGHCRCHLLAVLLSLVSRLDQGAAAGGIFAGLAPADRWTVVDYLGWMFDNLAPFAHPYPPMSVAGG